MPYRFKHHYTAAEARALLPQVRVWLARVRKSSKDFAQIEARLGGLLETGADAGGDLVHRWLNTLADLRDILRQFHNRDIQIKELDRGLVDFPGFVGGREVFLCWEEGEDDIEFWHDLDTGYAGRTKLD